MTFESIKQSLQEEARIYIEDCLRSGIMLDRIEAPLGFMAEVRNVYGPHTTLLQVAGNDWVAELTNK